MKDLAAAAFSRGRAIAEPKRLLVSWLILPGSCAGIELQLLATLDPRWRDSSVTSQASPEMATQERHVLLEISRRIAIRGVWQDYRYEETGELDPDLSPAS